MANIIIKVDGYPVEDVFNSGEKRKIETLKGSITLKAVGYKEKQKIVNSLGAKKTNKEESELLLEELSKRIVKMDVKAVDGSIEFVELDDLGYSEEGTLLLTSLQQSLVKGFPLGKTKKRD